ncbi:MAG TPA: LysR family transcriptional regulator [Propionicimonas sp.]|nr:LysR family transcriptional regulator [Propionicimonas sp.]
MPYDSAVLDLNRLRILRSVVASGSVNDTARRLGLTPSTVSQHIHTLEREVGFTLVERVGRGIQPTPAAIELALTSQDALAAMTKVDAKARELRQGATAKLTMRTFASAAYTWMPTVARTLRQEFPGLTLELSINETDSPELAGQADVEVHTELPYEEPRVPPGYRRIELGTDDLLVAMPPDHPLAEAGTMDLAEFSTDDWVHYDFRDDIATSLASHACAGAGFTPRYVVRAQDHVTGLAFVAAGVGIALVPQLAVGWSGFEIAYVRPTNPTPYRRIVAMLRNGAASFPAAARTIELLTDLGGRIRELQPIVAPTSAAEPDTHDS